MAASLKAEYACDPPTTEFSAGAVKFVVLKKQQNEVPEQATFEQAMLPHMDAAHNLARWLLRDEQDAQDIVQEAYLRAYRAFDRFHGGNARAWLLTIVRNAAYTLLKKKGAADVTTNFDEELHDNGGESITPVAALERSESAQLIEEAMNALPLEHKEILLLRHVEELSYKEIATVMQIAPGTVMSRLARARARLRNELAASVRREERT